MGDQERDTGLKFFLEKNKASFTWLCSDWGHPDPIFY